jgi:hypothetical protein
MKGIALGLFVTGLFLSAGLGVAYPAEKKT